MGKRSVTMPDELLALLEHLENVDELAADAVEAAEPIVVRALKEECGKHHKAKHDKTRGEMVDSIKATGAKKNRYGLYDFVRPTGKDSKGVSNMEKLAYLEYGTSKQPATPITQPVINRIGEEVREKMQDSFTKGARL